MLRKRELMQELGYRHWSTFWEKDRCPYLHLII